MTTAQRTTNRTTMQAITQDRYGEAQDVLRLEEIARPAIGEDEVLLRMLKTKPTPHAEMKGKKKPSPAKAKAKKG